MTGPPAEMDGLLRHRGGELAEALARQAAGVIAGRTFTDGQIDDAASAALAAVVSSLSGGSGEAPAGLEPDEYEALIALVEREAGERTSTSSAWRVVAEKLRAALRGPVGGGPGGEDAPEQGPTGEELAGEDMGG